MLEHCQLLFDSYSNPFTEPVIPHCDQKRFHNRMTRSPPGEKVLDLCSDEDAPPERHNKRHRKEVCIHSQALPSYIGPVKCGNILPAKGPAKDVLAQKTASEGIIHAEKKNLGKTKLLRPDFWTILTCPFPCAGNETEGQATGSDHRFEHDESRRSVACISSAICQRHPSPCLITFPGQLPILPIASPKHPMKTPAGNQLLLSPQHDP